MSQKRPRIEEDEDKGRSHQQGISYDIQRTSAFRSLVSEIMDMYAAPRTTRPKLECLLSRYVLETLSGVSNHLSLSPDSQTLSAKLTYYSQMIREGDSVFSGRTLLSSKNWLSGHQINEPEPKDLRLCWLNKISKTVHTGMPIKGENSQPLMVALVDGESGEVVKTGPEASARLKIVGLEPDFGRCLGEGWSSEEFKTKIVTKEGNGQLLTGNVVLDLKEGKARVDLVRFSHTKTWKKQREYRLGIMAVDDYIGTKIQEGFSNTIYVKDQRLDVNKKHHPPILSDEVWRLVGIGRNGAFHHRLSDEGVNKVEDLLKKLNTGKLRDILGKNMSEKTWEALVEHAQTCVVDETLYLFSSSECLRKTSVLFNMVGQVMGLISEFQYYSFEMSSESEKAQAIGLVVSAFQQWDKVVSFKDKASFDKYLGSNQIAYDLKSPTTESSSRIKTLIPPEDDELDLLQLAVPFDDKASLDQSPGLSNISPIEENSIDSWNSFCQRNADLDFSTPAFSFDDDLTFFGELPGPSNVICPPKSPTKEIDEPNFAQPVIPAQEIIRDYDSVWNMSYRDDYYNW